MHAPRAPHQQRAFIAAAQRGFFVASDELPVRAPHAPTSLIGYLVEALNCRRMSGLEPLTVISCDNLVDNGARLARAYDGLAAGG
jgi:mannitol-1-phosphate/altronate dehydrogenase